MEENMLSIGEAAKLLGVCENTLRDWDIENKFKAERTVGNHRRYTLDSIRDYLTRNPPVEEKKPLIYQNKHTKKWQESGWLNDPELTEVDKINLSILLENCANLDEFEQRYYDDILSFNHKLWLTKQGFMRSKLRRCITIQSMIGPASLVYFLKEKNGNKCIESEAVAAKTTGLDFVLFPNADFEKVKDVYADAIAAEMDARIFQILSKSKSIDIDPLVNVDNVYLNFTEYDFIIAPKGIIFKLKTKPALDNVDLIEYHTVLNPETFELLCVAGKYPGNYLCTPLFCPYVLFSSAAKTFTGFVKLAMRSGEFNEKM